MASVLDNPRNMLIYQQAVTGEKSMAQLGRDYEVTRAAIQDICKRVAKALEVPWVAARKVFLCKNCGNEFFGTGTYYGAKARFCEAHRGSNESSSTSDIGIAVDGGAL
jgi:hypothetical protein